MDDPVQTLANLGLTDKEAKVYFATLKLGSGSAQAIARNAGLKRPTTYVILEELRQKGLVLKMPGSKRQMFTAKSPEELVSQMKKNLSSVEQALPELMQTYSSNTPRVRTIQFEGIDGIREALWYRMDALAKKEVVAFFGSAEDATPELISLFHEWNAALAKNGVHIRSLVPENENLKEFRSKDATYGFVPRILPSSMYTSQSSIEISGTFVRVLMFKEQQALIIENPKLAHALREIFEMVWQKN